MLRLLLFNSSTASITIGTVTLPAGGTPSTAVDVPWQMIRSSPTAMADLIAGALTPVGPPGLDWEDLSIRSYSGTWQVPITLTADQSYTIPTTLFIGAFRTGRLYLITTAGSATVSLNTSADGSQTWAAMPDWTPVSISSSAGNTAVLLPDGVILLQGVLLAGASGWTGSVEFTLK